MTRNEIQSAILAAGVRTLASFGAADYAVPTVAWLTGPFWDYFRSTLWDDDLDKWQVKWECRDFARAYAVYAQVCNALTANSPIGTDALAVGEFWYHPQADATKGHAICACFTDAGLTFVEPQTGKVVTLSPIEIQSCYFVRF